MPSEKASALKKDKPAFVSGSSHGVLTAASGLNSPPSESAIETIASILQSLQLPLKTYLETIAPEQSNGFDDASADKLLALSPISPFLSDDTVSDIFINGAQEIYVNRNNTLEKTDVVFADARALHKLTKAIAGAVGKSLDPSRPLLDARLKDGSRVNIIAPPMAVDGMSVSIRKFPRQEITLESLIEKGEMSQQMAEFLKLCAEHRVSILISGGTGTGKTTLLNAISRYIPATERIITIEDTAELRLQQPHVVRLEIKEPQTYGERREEVNASDLVRNALRMRPDRIIIGEVRSVESYDMIQALNTGHDGSLTTVHANTARDALTRLENLMSPRLPNTPAASIRKQIVSAINLVVQLVYDVHGKRMVSSISEVVGMEGDIITMQDIFKLHEEADGAAGAIRYSQHWTNIIPHHAHLSQAMRDNPAFPVDVKKMAF